MKSISSAHNPLFRELRECLTSKGIKKHGMFLVSGERAVRDTLEKFPDLALHAIVNPSITEKRDFQGVPRSTLQLAPNLFEELDVFGTHAPLIVMKTPDIPKIDLAGLPEGLEIFCALSDPSNVGALLRSAAAFNASKVILLKESASPFHPRAARAASAATLVTPLFTGPSILDLATAPLHHAIVALDMKGEPLDRFKWSKDVRILMGEEGHGVPSGARFRFASIPMANQVESLNATVASSLAMYSYRLSFPL